VPPYVTEPLRLFLLDDHDIVRRGLRDLLAAARDITVVGESDSAAVATRLIPELETDVMVLDVHLQDGTGVHVCRDVRSNKPSVRGLLLTAAGDDEAAMASILAGASGYTVKMARTVDLVGHVRAVGTGTKLIESAVIERLLMALDEIVPPLSKRDRQIAQAIAHGSTNPQIAAQLSIDEAAIDSDVDRLIEAITGLRRGTGVPRRREPGRHSRTGN
jgi:two-component system, NarL family, response regulator DevR